MPLVVERFDRWSGGSPRYDFGPGLNERLMGRLAFSIFLQERKQ
jgi:hypothetical protein